MSRDLDMPVYFDYAASTPVDSRVAAAMSASLVSPREFGNPHAATHVYGHIAADLVERARGQVAGLINATADDIVWTSGATEANNLALIGGARIRASVGRHLITSVTEHPSVLDACRYLEQEGFTVTRLRPDANGIVTPSAVADALTPETTLVSIMHVNNEIGVVQDCEAIGEICRAYNVLFHVDAAQSAGRLPLDVAAQCIDLMSLSAQKLYGPKGVGALYLNRQRIGRIEPLVYGGGQERGLRPGTVPTHQVVGMGLAYEIAAREGEADRAHLTVLHEALWKGVSAIPRVLLNGHATRRSSHILNVSVIGVEGESLHYALRDLAVSGGSACTTATAEPSAVLRSLGRADDLARASVRFSWGRGTTLEDIQFAIATFCVQVERLRRLVPEARSALA